MDVLSKIPYSYCIHPHVHIIRKFDWLAVTGYSLNIHHLGFEADQKHQKGVHLLRQLEVTNNMLSGHLHVYCEWIKVPSIQSLTSAAFDHSTEKLGLDQLKVTLVMVCLRFWVFHNWGQSEMGPFWSLASSASVASLALHLSDVPFVEETILNHRVLGPNVHSRNQPLELMNLFRHSWPNLNWMVYLPDQ